MHDLFTRRFKELKQKQSTLVFTKNGNMGSPYSIHGEWKGWATSAQSLLRAVFGENGQYYFNFTSVYEKDSGSESVVRSLFHIFDSAKEDFDSGYVFDLELRVSGEVFGDFVGLARKSLEEGYKDVAAVLACAALEDALKRYAIANKLDVQDKTMADIINALKSAGLVAGAQKAILDRMPTIRNYALHANWEKISEPDIGGVIGFVEQFLLTKFSS